MRDIKFRAKPVENESRYTGWLYGNLVHITENYFGEEDFEEVDDWYIGSESGIEFEIQAETIGQYTGLKDKNGKKIYEGDILQHLYDYCDKTDRYIVKWDEDDLQYSFENIHKKGTYMALEDFYDDYNGDYSIEIIGNIYDNPELLKEE